jgi:hypothetical protein
MNDSEIDSIRELEEELGWPHHVSRAFRDLPIALRNQLLADANAGATAIDLAAKARGNRVRDGYTKRELEPGDFLELLRLRRAALERLPRIDRTIAPEARRYSAITRLLEPTPAVDKRTSPAPLDDDDVDDVDDTDDEPEPFHAAAISAAPTRKRKKENRS